MRGDRTKMQEPSHQVFDRTDSAGCVLRSRGMHPSKGERGRQHKQSSVQLSLNRLNQLGGQSDR